MNYTFNNKINNPYQQPKAINCNHSLINEVYNWTKIALRHQKVVPTIYWMKLMQLYEAFKHLLVVEVVLKELNAIIHPIKENSLLSQLFADEATSKQFHLLASQFTKN